MSNDVLIDLERAAARELTDEPYCRHVGLFARAFAEVRRLRETLVKQSAAHHHEMQEQEAAERERANLADAMEHAQRESADRNARQFMGFARNAMRAVRVAIEEGDDDEALRLIAEALGEEA